MYPQCARSLTFTAIVAFTLTSDGTLAQTSDNPHNDFFKTKVHPVLQRNCLNCHGSAQLGGLRMDTPEDMMKGGKDGPILTPGKPDESLLIRAISYNDPHLRMPPRARLKDEEIAILETWVRDGAIWGGMAPSSPVVTASKYDITPEQRAFWSFQPVRKPAPPPVKDTAGVRGPVDNFILAKIEARGLKPVKPADRRTLIRRATFDLIGLPPTPQEIDNFVNDPSADAFAKIVDRLLASPHYGERWGRYWLDVARYSDYQLTAEGDGPLPKAFQYRDWVVRAFNEDMPFDQFVKAQIAGDQMAAADRAKYAGGLGFYSLSPKPEFRDERVDATTRGFLGLTVACAQCHDHKYDPIPTRDFYSILGIFESTEFDKFPLAPADVVAKYEKHKKVLDDEEAVLKKFLDNQRGQLFDIFAERSATYMQAAWRVLGPEKRSVADLLIDTKGLDKGLLERWVGFLDPSRKREYSSFDAFISSFQQSRSEAAAREAPEEFQVYLVAARREQKELDAKNAVIRAQTKAGETPKALPFERTKYYLMKDLVAEPDKKKTNDLGGPFWFSADEVATYVGSVYKDHLATLRTRIEKMKAALPSEYPYYPTIKDKAKPQNLRVHIRGNPETLGQEAPRQFLAILSPETQKPFTKGSGRLELAEAIADPQNPLTARVMVNRLWQHHFGAGIVDTPSNFGKLGSLPSHPELLDYLASRFVENGWSVKAMHREIMLSATYALSSEYSEANFQQDGDNRLLWRANVRRLDVEAMRDSLLFVAGKLDASIGGPALPLHDEKNLRRTIYSEISRAKPDAFLRLFDFPDPNETSEKRLVTNVPVQQLFFLNSDFVRNQAEALSKRIKMDGLSEDKIAQAYRILFGRAPSQTELKLGADSLHSAKLPFPDYLSVLLSSNEFNYVN